MKRQTRILLPIIVLLSGAALAAGLVRLRPEVERREVPALPPLVRAVVTEPRELQLAVRSQGTVVPGVESILVAQVAGSIEWVSPQFAAGGRFRRGDLLARIDDADYRLALSRAEAEIARARTRLDLELAEAEQAQRDWKDLGEGEASPLTLRQPQVAEARSTLQGAEAALEQASLNLERTRITTPYEGRLRHTSVHLGQFVTPGTPLAEVFSTEYAEIRLPVSGSDLGFLEKGLGESYQSAGPSVLLEGDLGGELRSWSARIVRSGGEFDPRTRMLPLFARVEDPFGGKIPLPMGLYVSASIEGRTVEAAAVLPRSALRSDDQVLVVDDEERLRFRGIDVLRIDRDEVIVEAGLERGERVCISPLETVVDGMSVRVAKETSIPAQDPRELL